MEQERYRRIEVERKDRRCRWKQQANMNMNKNMIGITHSASSKHPAQLSAILRNTQSQTFCIIRTYCRTHGLRNYAQHTVLNVLKHTVLDIPYSTQHQTFCSRSLALPPSLEAKASSDRPMCSLTSCSCNVRKYLDDQMFDVM